jgi:hypothetical protein
MGKKGFSQIIHWPWGKRVITLNWGKWTKGKYVERVITLAIHERRGYHTGYGLSHWL